MSTTGTTLPDAPLTLITFALMATRGTTVAIDLAQGYSTGFNDGDAGGFARGVGAGLYLGGDRADDAAAYFDGERRGFRVGLSVTSSAGVTIAPSGETGFAAGRRVGQRSRDEDAAFDRGRDTGLRQGSTLGGGGAAAVTLPALTISVSSPTPGAAPGGAGGFPGDFGTAEATPILIQIPTAVNIAYVCVIATFKNFPKVGEQISECVYRRGAFQANYIELSSQLISGGTLNLTCARVEGWPVGTGTLGDIVFDVDAINLSGVIT